jgi:manganese oxidase
MDSQATRREFIRSSSVAAAGLAAAGATHIAHAQHEHSSHESAPEQSRHESHGEYFRTRPGPGGPVGSPTDRGKLVSGYRSVDEPPVGVVVPDLPTLPSEIKDGVREFHLIAQHVKREILPGKFFDLWVTTVPRPDLSSKRRRASESG